MSRLAVGVDVGGTKVLAVLVDRSGALLAEARRATPLDGIRDAPGVAVVDEVALALADLAAAAGTDLTGLPLGVGVPGMVSHAGVLTFGPNLHSATGADMTKLLGIRLRGWQATVANDADAAAFAEHRLGAAQGEDEFAMVTLGTGIGGGIVTGGRILRGRRGYAAEIGHMIVDPPVRAARAAGGAAGSGTHRARASRGSGVRPPPPAACPPWSRCAATRNSVRGEDVTHAAAAGDKEALAVLDEVGWWLALGLANLAAVLDPGRFVLGGGLIEASTLLLPPARRHLTGLLEAGELREPIEVVAADLGAHAGAIGAALLSQER